MIKLSNQNGKISHDQFSKGLTKTRLSNDDVKELSRQQFKATINQILQAELTALLGYGNGFNSDNSRNDQYYRLFDSEYGKLKIAVPRDRQGQFYNYLLASSLFSSSRCFRNNDHSAFIPNSKGVTTREIADLVKSETR